MSSGEYRFVGGVAALLTLINAVKPLTIDDPVFHALAAQIARDPFDPYGFTFHWYQSPQPAFDIPIIPALLPYWLAPAVGLFADHPIAWKLWLLPISLLLVGALHALFRRWAPGIERPLVVLTVLSPALLPSFNLMVDVPALALGLGALAVFARAVDVNRAALAIAAGVLAGLSAQTKYTEMLSPCVLLVYAAVWRRWRLGVLAAVVAAAVFLAWEACMWRAYGELYLLHHAPFVAARIGKKLNLPLIANLGGVATPVLLLGLAALGLSGGRLALAGALVVVGYVVLAAAPAPDNLVAQIRPLRWTMSAPIVVCGAYGIAFFAVIAMAVARLARRHRTPGRAPALPEQRRDDLFVILWFALEILGFYAFSPFGAVRRVLGIFVASVAVAGRLAARTQRPRAVRAVAALGVVLGLAFEAVDLHDANAARSAVARAVERIGPPDPGATIWYAGHWGLQFYAERAGLRAVVPGESILRRGDWLLIPDHRIDQQRFALPAAHVAALEPAVEITDALPLATVSTYYAGFVPLLPQRGPRFRLTIYRVHDDFLAAP